MKRLPFSTPAGLQVLDEAKHVRGYKRKRADRVHALLVDYFDRHEGLSNVVRHGATRWTETIEDAACREVIAGFVPGLWERLAWSAVEFFIRWLVRRLIRRWTAEPAEFLRVMEGHDVESDSHSPDPPGRRAQGRIPS